MHYHIDKTAAQSAYLQLYHQLRRDIVSGVYLLGTKMPSKRLIATETGVSVITVEHALAILCDEGYLESRERSGFFVSFAAADCFAALPASVGAIAPGRMRVFEPDHPFFWRGIHILPFSIPHDSAHAVGYTFADGSGRCAVPK